MMNRVQWSLLIPSILLTGIGFVLFATIDQNIFRNQLLYLGISLIAYVIFSHLDYKMLAHYAHFLYILSLAFLGILFIIGFEARGAVRWIDIAGFSIQFSEVLKPFFILTFASFITSDNSRSFGKYIKIITLFLPIFILILKQPDLGNGMIYLFVLGFLLLFAHFRALYFIIIGILALLPMPLLFHMLHEYQKNRIYAFFNITADPSNTTYNAVQSIISVGSGGVFGKGIGHATQSILKFLPERHTDFIFATLAETFGLLGGVVLLSLYVYLLWRIYKVAQLVSDPYTYLVLIGFYFLLLTHVFLNIGMNIGVVPIVGITLPFVSYGGSSLLTNFISLGIISAIALEYRQKHSWEIN